MGNDKRVYCTITLLLHPEYTLAVLGGGELAADVIHLVESLIRSQVDQMGNIQKPVGPEV